MEPILKTIAREYSGRYKDLKPICFLFPNKRCGIFLKKYFAQEGRAQHEMPHVLTITDLAGLIAKRIEAGRVVQLFTLYNSYKEILGDKTVIDFESFRGWGETVLSDFNTVDLNMSNPDEIFKNVKDFREISSNFLTDEQREVMREYFGFDDCVEKDGFWKNFDDLENLSPLKKNFFNLWQILGPLHKSFINKLENNGLGTTGSIFRRASELIKQKGREILPYKKVVVVGFNALTESERVIFKSLKDSNGYKGYDEFADFIWDSYGPFLNGKDFSASRFVNYNKKIFPIPGWFSKFLENTIDYSYPEIEIVSAPSLSAQVKVAAEVLKNYNTPEFRKLIGNAETALVLPDETLLSNALFSIPDNIKDINLTMSYNLRHTAVATFISLLRRLFISSRHSKNPGNFYVADLKLLLSHPYCQLLFSTNDIEVLLDHVNRRHKVRLSYKEIKEFLSDPFDVLALPTKEDSIENVFKYIVDLLTKLTRILFEREENESDNPDISQINVYVEYVNDVATAVREYNIDISAVSAMQMVDRLVADEKIGFEGEPLSGLQVMGTLETRVLDFRHVIILSMNEGVMPRKTMTSTFIPDSLRKAYGLPPARYAEEIFAYYFYRLISRAEKVTLIYDARADSGLKGSESRYLLQLKEWTPSGTIKKSTWQYNLQIRQPHNATIDKTPEIFEKIEAYSNNNKNESIKNFSASSLNTYRVCQVRFFLQNLMNINTDPERGEYMDAIAIGDVVHGVMMDIYSPKLNKNWKKPVEIDEAFLKEYIENPNTIRNLVLKNVNRIYYGIDDSLEEIESGVTEVIVTQIIKLVKTIIEHDLSLTPFNIFGCEISEKIRVRMPSGRIVNFNFAIDRLDEIEVNGERRLRVVDYKTGGKKRSASSLREIFAGGESSQQIFQLFLYAWLLGKLGVEGWEDTVTEIYSVPDMVKGENGYPEIGDERVENFRPYIEEFESLLNEMIESLFESPQFVEVSDILVCKKCPLKTICRR